jgi:hypothetical protein
MGYMKCLSYCTLLLFLNSCSLDSMRPPTILVSKFTFEQDVEGWQPSYTNYAPSSEDSFKFSFTYTKFHVASDTVRAMVQTAYNKNSKLFMYVKRQISGLTPNKTYSITIKVHLYSQLRVPFTGDTTSNSKGSFLKVGVFRNEPINDTIPDSLITGEYIIIPGFDPGQVTTDGADMIYVGKISFTGVNQSPDFLEATNTGKEILETADNDGKVWIVIGVDTNIPVYQSIYYSGIGIQFEEK